MNITKVTGRVLGQLSFFLLLFFFHPVGLSQEANAVLATSVWIAIWRIIEAIPIAVTALLPMVLFPLSGGLDLLSAANKRKQFINWEEAVKMTWGIILLFSGGMALAKGFEVSGLAVWMGSQMTGRSGLPILLLIFVLVAAVNVSTKISANLATTAILLPVLAPMTLTIDVHLFVLMVGLTIAASYAFMHPTATPPHDVVLGSGYLRIPDMVRKGFFMNVVSIFTFTLFIYFVCQSCGALLSIPFLNS